MVTSLLQSLETRNDELSEFNDVRMTIFFRAVVDVAHTTSTISRDDPLDLQSNMLMKAWE
jgi:hypothetical protein